MMGDLNRRRFLQSTAAAGVVTIVPRHVLGGTAFVAPSERITLAHIGMGTEGFREIGDLLVDPRVQIVSVCDPNTDSNDYLEWGENEIYGCIRKLLGNPAWRDGQTGCPGGREVGREVVDAYYAKNRGTTKFRACSVYADFRELLDRERDLDAVKIMTPDHHHATIAIAAMKKGKHVLMHKPIANRMGEGRLVLEMVRQTKVATHLLAYGVGAGNGLIAQRVKEGVIGPLREVHNWTNRPVWPQYTEIPKDHPPVPKGLDWDLWLGPATDRPYHPNYTHTVFRSWYDFGGGSMADMGIYSLWPVFTALGLGVPNSAEAWATHTCSSAKTVCRTDRNDFSYPTACTIRLKFPAPAPSPPLDIFWYDGGMKPRLPLELEAQDIEVAKEGILFVGDQGAILAGYFGQQPRLFAKGKCEPLETRDASSQHASDGKDPSARAINGWIEAVQGREASPGNFLNAASITDAVNLGSVALRAGRKVVFDSDNLKITNVADANKCLNRQYREGWKL